MAKKTRDDLSAMQLRFCEEYVSDLDATQAAIRAGYSPHTARVQASKLLTRPNIQKQIQALKMIRSDAVASRAEDTIREVALLAHSDMADFVNVDSNGNVTPKPFDQLKPGQSRCIRSIKQKKIVRKVHGVEGETLVESTFEFSLWDKPKCLDLEGQYHTIWNQKSSELPEDAAAQLLSRVADALEGRHGDSGPA